VSRSFPTHAYYYFLLIIHSNLIFFYGFVRVLSAGFFPRSCFFFLFFVFLQGDEKMVFFFLLQVIQLARHLFLETLMAGWLSNGLCQRVVETTAPPSLQVERFEICKQRRKKLLDHYD
jgi:hypothetical protein